MSDELSRFRLEGRVALVGGGSGGIGLRACTALAGVGADVAIIGRSAERLEEARAAVEKAGRRALVHAADMTSRKQADAAVERTGEALGQVSVVVNGIGGGGVDVGEELVSNPMVDMVSFTGSVPAGRRVGALAAQTVKKVQLELGGKSASIALDDAEPATVVMNTIAGCMTHAGQGCGCTTRLLVPQTMHDAVVEQFVATCSALPVGDPRDENTVVGPLIREQHRQLRRSRLGHGHAVRLGRHDHHWQRRLVVVVRH